MWNTPEFRWDTSEWDMQLWLMDPRHTSPHLDLTNNNLTVAMNAKPGTGQNCLSYSNKGKTAGKWYLEVTYDLSDSDYLTFGVVEFGHSINIAGEDSYPGDSVLSYGLYCGDGEIYNDGNNLEYGEAVTEDDILSMALDMDNGEIYWGLNGTWFDTGNPATRTNPAYTGLSGTKYPSGSLLDDVAQYTVNFGASDFSHTVPVGFSAFNS